MKKLFSWIKIAAGSLMALVTPGAPMVTTNKENKLKTEVTENDIEHAINSQMQQIQEDVALRFRKDEVDCFASYGLTKTGKIRMIWKDGVLTTETEFKDLVPLTAEEEKRIAYLNKDLGFSRDGSYNGENPLKVLPELVVRDGELKIEAKEVKE